MQRDQLPVDDIVIPSRLRKTVNEEAVASLVESIGRIGLQTPITVRWQDSHTAVLVAGNHRLEAVKRLGQELIDCVIFDGTDTEARMWEIAENLHRADLTVVERSEHVAEWVKLSERVLAHFEPKPQGGRPEGGVRAASRELGLDRNSVQRAIKIAGLPDDVKAQAREEDWSQSRLLEATRTPRPAPPPREADNDIEVINRQVDALMRAWNKASRQARDLFLEKVDVPVFDRTRAA